MSTRCFPSVLPRSLTMTCAAAALLLATACATTGPSQSVSLLEPANGATVTSPFKVRFGVQGMTVQPAGNMTEGTGHHHLLINLAAVPAGAVVTFSPQHLHFGAGQTETMVTLSPGTYTLTAQFANGAHQSYGPAMSQTVTVTVK